MYDFVEFKDRRTSKSNTYKVTNNSDGTITLTPTPGDIIEAGTPLNAAHLNVSEHGVNEAIIMAGSLVIQMLQAQRDLSNTFLEIGSKQIYSEENYPFNTAVSTVALKTSRNTLDYVVLPYCDDVMQGRQIRIKDKQLNGFKIEVEDCPNIPITIKYFVFGGMYNV